MGPRTRRLPLAADQARICHGPLYRLLCCCQVRVCPWVPPVQPPIAAVSIATLCHVHFQVSSHTAGGFHFVIGCCMASHCCCLHRHTLPCATFRS
ncbi:unnamed protein product, partial [Staurois parvus]